MRQAHPSDIAGLVREARERKPLLLLCDFDGTLCEFQADPAAVWLSNRRRRLLEVIARQPSSTVGLVSGRRLADVSHRSGLSTDIAFIAGLHGLEIEGGGERFSHPELEEAPSRAHRIAADLAPLVAQANGVFIEDKGFSIALHFRQASSVDRTHAMEALERLARGAVESGAVRIMRGSNVLEVLPNIAWNKGNAVEWIRTRVERRNGAPFTVYIGDDATDEDAFVATRPHGLSIAASNRVTGADYALDGPAEVEALLQEIADLA